MSTFAIRADSLSKEYRLGAAAQGRLTDAMWDGLGRLRRLEVGKRAHRDVLWALRDISFEVKEGEAVGFMGRNGAGKTTLLKVLSRITKPTTGFADIRGRVGSLLEVGSGFHPDLTGRENVYLYGAVLGMRNTEVRRKFDEIVAFAEVERFLDTPVKRYSSGMYMRLAFAVAAHLEPEILIVDEVLAVGDISFQQKCLGKMNETTSSGRTVLFVSHNTAAVSALCERAYLLDGGRIVSSGPAADIVDEYLEAARSTLGVPVHERTDRSGDGSILVTTLKISDEGGGAVTSSSRLRIELAYTSAAELRNARFALSVQDDDGVLVFYRLDTDVEHGLPDRLPPSGTLVCVTDPINLTAGDCRVKVAAWRGGALADLVEGAATFTIHADDFYPSGRPPTRYKSLGLIRHEWRVSDTE